MYYFVIMQTLIGHVHTYTMYYTVYCIYCLSLLLIRYVVNDCTIFMEWNELLTNRYYPHLFDTVAGHCVDTWWSHNRRVWACWCCCTGAEQWRVPLDNCSSSLPASGLGCTQQYYSTVERDYHVFCVGYTECIIWSVVNTVVVTCSLYYSYV